MYLVDGYVNFGILGVILFSLFVGQLFRWFRLSRDIAFRSMWPLLALVLFTSPLIGTMLGSGFTYMVLHALLVRVTMRSRSDYPSRL